MRGMTENYAIEVLEKEKRNLLGIDPMLVHGSETKKQVIQLQQAISQLQGEMIAEGIVGQEDIGGKLNVGNYLEHDIIFKILEYEGEQVQLIIRKVKE
jgi:hypothetical protein